MRNPPALAAVSLLAVVVAGLVAGQQPLVAAGDDARPATTVDGATPDGDVSAAEAAMQEQLAKPDFTSRQQAMVELWRSRDTSRDAVHQAARDPDPEVAERAKWVLRQWRLGALPETPEEITRSIRRADVAVAVEELIDAGQFEAAVVAVEESLGTIERESVQTRVSRLLVNRFPIFARTAFEHDAVNELLQLVDLVADSKELAVCRIELLRFLDRDLTSVDLLPGAAEGWSPADRDRASVLVLVVLGRLDEAIELAETNKANDPTLLRVTRMLAGRWQELAVASAQQARGAERGSSEFVGRWSDALIAADRCGHAAIRTEAIEQLSSADIQASLPAAWLRWRTLAIHGEVELACDALRRESAESAAELARASSRMDLSFELLELERDSVEMNLDGWIEDALIAQQASEAEQTVLEVNRLLAVMESLWDIGRRDLAWRIAAQLCGSRVAVGHVHLRDHVLNALDRYSHDDWVRQLAVSQDDTLSAVAQQILSRTFTEIDPSTFGVLLKAVEEQYPRHSVKDRIAIACALADGRTHPEFDSKVGFQSLYQFLAQNPGRQPERLGQHLMLSSRMPLNVEFSRLFSRHGQADLAERCLLQLARQGDVEAIFQLAEQALEGGRAGESRRYYDYVWQAATANGRLRSSTNRVELAAKALVGMHTIALRTGDQEQVKSLESVLRLTLCSPSSDLRFEIIQSLSAHGQRQLADAGYRVLLPLTAFGTSEGTEFFQVAGQYSLDAAETAPQDVAQWIDLVICGTLETVAFYPRFYVTWPVHAHRHSLHAAIASDDEPAAKQIIDKIIQLNPLDVTFAEELLPKMREAGMEGLATAALDEVLDTGREHAQEFAFDATTANNLAWVAAMNEQRLDDAIELAEQAVYVEPDSAIYRDTLAEVLYLLGRREEAIHVEKACILDDPGQWHLHQQVERFSEPQAEDSSAIK